MLEEAQKGDTGTPVVITLMDGATAFNITTAIAMAATLLKPSGTTVTHACTLYTTTTGSTTGMMQFITLNTTFDEAGIYKLQTIITFTGTVWHSSISKFKVGDNL